MKEQANDPDVPGTAETVVYLMSILVILGAVISRLGLSLHPIWATLISFILLFILTKYKIISNIKLKLYSKSKDIVRDIKNK